VDLFVEVHGGLGLRGRSDPGLGTRLFFGGSGRVGPRGSRVESSRVGRAAG